MSGANEKSIQLSVLEIDKDQFCQVKLTSLMFPSKPELICHMESVQIDQPFPVFCKVNRIEQTHDGNTLVVLLHGNLERKKGGVSFPPDGQELPYQMELKFSAESYRVVIEGKMRQLPPGIEVRAFGPCFQGIRFSKENRPPFDMARQSFTFFEERGLGWISDADRIRSERHDTDDGGAWIQHFQVEGANVKHLGKRVGDKFSPDQRVLPLVGWVAKDNSYMIGLAGEHVYDIAIRWFPCLHADMLVDEKDGAAFKSAIYIVPVDLDRLAKMYQQDFDVDSERFLLSQDALWPFNPGTLMDGLEALEPWHVSGGKLVPYTSQEVWINGNYERDTYPEGVTDGGGSALWEIPAGQGEVAASRRLTLPEGVASAITHISIDAMNRGPGEVCLEGVVEAGASTISKSFILRHWANRRLLIPLSELAEGRTGLERLNFILKIHHREEPVRIVLDNLRIYEGDRG